MSGEVYAILTLPERLESNHEVDGGVLRSETHLGAGPYYADARGPILRLSGLDGARLRQVNGLRLEVIWEKYEATEDPSNVARQPLTS